MRKPSAKAAPPLAVKVVIREGSPSLAAICAWERLWQVILSENKKPPAATGGGDGGGTDGTELRDEA